MMKPKSILSPFIRFVRFLFNFPNKPDNKVPPVSELPPVPSIPNTLEIQKQKILQLELQLEGMNHLWQKSVESLNQEKQKNRLLEARLKEPKTPLQTPPPSLEITPHTWIKEFVAQEVAMRQLQHKKNENNKISRAHHEQNIDINEIVKKIDDSYRRLN